MESRETILQVRHLSYGYHPGNPVLKDVNVSVRRGEKIAVMGANGAGKSTFFLNLNGVLQAETGEIFYEGQKTGKKNLNELRKHVGFVFQDADSQLFMSNVYEDLAFAPRNYGLSESEVEERVQKALEMVHIEHLKDKQVYKMSGGEKKLVSIATILTMMPDVILMDEPSVALDPKNRRNLIHILNGFRQMKIIASHDLDMILDTCSRVILMSDGKIIRDGDVKEILFDKELLEAHGLELPFCMQGAVSV